MTQAGATLLTNGMEVTVTAKPDWGLLGASFAKAGSDEQAAFLAAMARQFDKLDYASEDMQFAYIATDGALVDEVGGKLARKLRRLAAFLEGDA